MFKLPVNLSPRPGLHELADFLEWDAWQNGFSSARAVAAELGRIDDNSHNEGCEDSSDECGELIEDAFGEVEDRIKSCGGAYPFEITNQGHSMTHCGVRDKTEHVVYRFLLLVTRMNMKSHKKQGTYDGTQLFEELMAEVLRNYFGVARVKSQVFGTAEGNRFSEKVDQLCDQLREGGRFKQWDTGRVKKNDGGIDIVTWLPFSDGKANQLILFAQCKTGDSWDNEHGKLRPDAFFKTWTESRCVSLNPVSAFCVAEAADRSRWLEYANQTGGLFFDRCRIVDRCSGLSEPLVIKLVDWTAHALDFLNSRAD